MTNLRTDQIHVYAKLYFGCGTGWWYSTITKDH